MTNDGAENYNGQINSNTGKHPNLGLFLNCSINDVICREILTDLFTTNILIKKSSNIKLKRKSRAATVAYNPNLVWHTDWHDLFEEDLNHKEYLIAFIDAY